MVKVIDQNRLPGLKHPQPPAINRTPPNKLATSRLPPSACCATRSGSLVTLGFVFGE